MTEMNEVPLDGGWQTDVRRAGDVVLRSPKPQSRTVVGLLTHLAQVGFDASPRPLDGGFASDGREQLGFIEGESPQPRPWSDDAVWEIGRMVNALHFAAASFEVPTDAHWRPWFARRARQAALILDGYGLAQAQRVGFVDRLVEMAIRCAREEAIEFRVEHDTASPAANGYPVLWAVSWRARSAAWVLDHRSLIQHAIDA